ncbi:cytochrome c oxidase assembly protein [Thalassiella azotivora]
MTGATRTGLGVGTVLLVPVVAVAALLASGGLEAPAPGLPDPGTLTRWGLPVARAIHDAAAAVTIGLLVLVAVVLPPDPGVPAGRLGRVRAEGVRLAAVAGTVWAVAGATVLALTYSDLAGTGPSTPGTGGQLLSFVFDFDLGRSLAASLAMVIVVATGAALATRLTTVAVMALIALAALWPLALTGHTAGASNHEAAVDTQAAHLFGVSIWVGGLAGLALLRRSLGDRFAVAARRFSTLAGWCFALVAASGVLGALVRSGGWSGLASAYGLLLGAKVIAIVVLGAAGWVHRRRILAALDTSPATGRAFARLAAGELVVMAVATGLAVALARTSPVTAGAPPEPVTLTESLLGYPMPPPLGVAEWFTQWRIDTVWAPVAVAAAAWYLAAVIRLRRRGDHWSVPRTIGWLAGCLVLIWATSGGPTVYGRVLFSMHMVEHMTIGTLVPILLVLGAPITLALRTTVARRDGSRGPREWLLLTVHSKVFRSFAHPVVAPILFIGSLIVFYYSPALELSLRTHTGHVLMTAHFIIVGYLFAWVICGPDPGPKRPVYPIRLIILIATMAYHAFYGVSMMDTVDILAQDWFASLDRTWGPTLAQDQYRGGALAWALGDYPVAILAVAMALAWIRDDARETRRHDRKADRDGDADLAAYNAMLQRRAAAHTAPQPQPATRGSDESSTASQHADAAPERP